MANWYQQVVWDYNLTQQEFEDILSGKTDRGQLNQAWATARILENLSFYDALRLVPLARLRQNWAKVKPKIFNRSIRNGYEFTLQRYALPAAR